MSDFFSLNALANWHGDGGTTHGFPDPWMDQASQAIPEGTNRILRFAEYIFNAQGVYRQAIHRVLAYFITDVDVTGDFGDDEKNKRKKFLNETLGIHEHLRIGGLDLLCYGNGFFSVVLPIRRYLSCPKCFSEVPYKVMAENKELYKFRWANFQFHAQCPKCKFDGDWGAPIDRRGRPEDVVIKRWNPHHMEIKYDPWTEKAEYIWRIPSDYRQDIRSGKNSLLLEQANWDVVQAIKNNENFKFADDTIFHLKEPSLSGMENRGWGLPPTLVNFRQIWYLQVLHRYNEALALDYIVPFRVITPGTKNSVDGGATEPLLDFSLASFTSKVGSMLKNHRRDPARWNVLPYPIQYQAIGGDARQLAPKDLMDQGYEILLTSLGMPVQMFKGDMNMQAAPAALRLFESYWNFIVHSLNKLLRFINRRLEYLFSWQAAVPKLGRVTHLDNLMRQQVLLQLMMGGQISQTTGMKSVNLDFDEELRRKLDEQSRQAEEERKQQESESKDMSMRQLMQAPPQQPGMPGDPNAQAAGGQPGMASVPGGGGAGIQGMASNMPSNPNAPITPQDVLGRAQGMASQLLTLDEGSRASQLSDLRNNNPLLHSLVRANMDNMRSKMRSTGGAMLQAQMRGGQQQGGQ